MFPLRILVQSDAVEKWSAAAGRPLSGTEEYAVAKMRLFQALDEVEDIEAHADLLVDGTNLTALLDSLDMCRKHKKAGLPRRAGPQAAAAKRY